MSNNQVSAFNLYYHFFKHPLMYYGRLTDNKNYPLKQYIYKQTYDYHKNKIIIANINFHEEFSNYIYLYTMLMDFMENIVNIIIKIDKNNKVLKVSIFDNEIQIESNCVFNTILTKNFYSINDFKNLYQEDNEYYDEYQLMLIMLLSKEFNIILNTENKQYIQTLKNNMSLISTIINDTSNNDESTIINFKLDLDKLFTINIPDEIIELIISNIISYIKPNITLMYFDKVINKK